MLAYQALERVLVVKELKTFYVCRLNTHRTTSFIGGENQSIRLTGDYNNECALALVIIVQKEVQRLDRTSLCMRGLTCMWPNTHRLSSVKTGRFSKSID